jgi:hypothetical protein
MRIRVSRSRREDINSNQRGRARWQFRRIHCFDSVSKKSQVIQERLHSEERKRGRTLGFMEEVAGQKIMEKQRQQRETAKSFKHHPWLAGREKRS